MRADGIAGAYASDPSTIVGDPATAKIEPTGFPPKAFGNEKFGVKMETV